MKKIKIDLDEYTYVDDEDYEKVLEAGTWSCCEKITSASSSKKYAYAYIKKGSKNKQVLMHRFIVNASKCEIVKHKDLNTLNNCKSNLKILKKNKINKEERRGTKTNIWAKETGHEFRSKIALFLNTWRHNRCLRTTANILKTNHGYTGRVLNHSKTYLKFKNQFRGKYSQEDNIYASQWAKKMTAIELLGSKCYECGNSNIFQLDFHHKDPSEKDYNLSHMFGDSMRWVKIKNEVLKCELLCRNCHALKHTDTDKVKKLNKLILNIKRFRL